MAGTAPRSLASANTTLLRTFFILLIIAGGALGIIYPWATANRAGAEIGRWRVYEREDGFTPAEAGPASSQGPVVPAIKLFTLGPLERGDHEPVLTVTVDTQGHTVLAQALDFEDAEASVVNPQTGEHLYRAELPGIETREGGRYLFTFGPGTAAEEQLVAVDLVLRPGAPELDPRAVPAGFVLMAVGLVGFISSSRRRRPANPNSSPPPRWGRGS